MSREQIRVRVDIEQWERWREEGEGNTELLARILQDWQQQQQVLKALTAIDLNPAQAIGRLLTSHELLSTAAVTIQTSAAPSAHLPLSSPADAPDPVTAEVVDGLENNGDDW